LLLVIIFITCALRFDKEKLKWLRRNSYWLRAELKGFQRNAGTGIFVLTPHYCTSWCLSDSSAVGTDGIFPGGETVGAWIKVLSYGAVLTRTFRFVFLADCLSTQHSLFAPACI